MRTDRKTPASILALVVGLCGLTMALGYFNKARCGGAPFAPDGRSLNFDVNKDIDVCYSDIQLLWLGRGIDQHLFPFVTGGITPEGFLTGGTVEYPVLSGILMWLGGIGSHTDTDFLLHSALILAPFGLLTAWMLGKMSGAYALVWSATPPLVLYAFHNWELPVVATSVGAIFLMTFERIPLRTRAVLAAVILAIGFCLKLYPGMFVLPLMAYVLLRGTEGKRYDVRGALMTAGAAIVTVVLVNLPFALISLRRLARVVQLPGEAKRRHHHQLGVVLGVAPVLRFRSSRTQRRLRRTGEHPVSGHDPVVVRARDVSGLAPLRP